MAERATPLEAKLAQTHEVIGRVGGVLALALSTRRVTPRVLLEQVEQLKLGTQLAEEAIALLPGRRQDEQSAP